MLHTREIAWIGAHQFYAENGLRLSLGAIIKFATFPLTFGSIGVPVFFVLSGYCIHRYQAFLAASGKLNSFSPRVFLLRRFFRIYPVLFGALALTFVADMISASCYPPSPKLGNVDFLSFLRNIASLQGLFGATYGSNDALWTLSIEVQFYALYPLLLVVMRRAGLARTLACLTVLNVASYFVLERHGLRAFSSFYVSWFLGVAIAETEANHTLVMFISNARRAAAVKITALALLGAGCGVFFLSQYAAFNVWAIAFALYFGTRIAIGSTFKTLFARAMAKVGEYSYSLYIVHLPIVVMLLSLVYRSARQSSLWPFVWKSRCRGRGGLSVLTRLRSGRRSRCLTKFAIALTL